MSRRSGTGAHHPQKCGERSPFYNINGLQPSPAWHKMLRSNGWGGPIDGGDAQDSIHFIHSSVDIGDDRKEVRRCPFHSPNLAVEAAGT